MFVSMGRLMLLAEPKEWSKRWPWTATKDILAAGSPYPLARQFTLIRPADECCLSPLRAGREKPG